MRKRGHMLVIIALITTVIAIFVFLTFPNLAKDIKTGKIILKEASARDIALIIDTIYAYPYDMEVEYNVDLSDFVVQISQNTVKIRDAEYSFVPVNDNPDFALNRPKKIIFTKTDGKLTVIGIK